MHPKPRQGKNTCRVIILQVCDSSYEKILDCSYTVNVLRLYRKVQLFMLSLYPKRNLILRYARNFREQQTFGKFKIVQKNNRSQILSVEVQILWLSPMKVFEVGELGEGGPLLHSLQRCISHQAPTGREPGWLTGQYSLFSPGSLLSSDAGQTRRTTRSRCFCFCFSVTHSAPQVFNLCWIFTLW